MDPGLLEMLEEHIQSFRDEDRIKTLKQACDKLVEKDDTLLYSFLIGSLYGSCHFIRDSYSSKERCRGDDVEFNELIYNHIKGLNASIKKINEKNLL